ncbi:MAG: DUF91 domain-containing protein [Candidatus Lokiarchaeota archaeon]|nr:DUF91 domain-containing protein [Candidatus Lokiarchaeota archaeon]
MKLNIISSDEMQNSYRIEYYREKGKYNEELSKNSDFLEAIRIEFGLIEQIKSEFEDIEIKEIFKEFNIVNNNNDEDLSEIEDYYTSIIVKAATNMKVKVSKLFRTHSKKYKIFNFVVIFKNNQPYKVFPHIKGKRTYTVITGLKEFLKEEFKLKKIKESEIKTDLKFTERDLQKLLANYPNLIENGLEFVDLEAQVEGGSIDCIFKDNNERYLLIETKLKATDQLTGQILRYANTFMKEFQTENVRKGIACIEISPNRIETFKDLGIEVFKINIEKI